jgi:putative acetyltransferase
MIKITRTDSVNTDFIHLVSLLDADLSIRDGKDHAYYKQYNKIENIKYVVVAYLAEEPIGCGAIKYFEEGAAEVKRMFVKEGNRSQGVGSTILKELELWSKELGFKNTVLETGKKQPEAIRLYQKNGYSLIANYGQYIGMDNSVCMKKEI